MKTTSLVLAGAVLIPAAVAFADHHGKSVGDDVIAAQRAALAKNTDGAGFGPQAPRDIESVAGTNTRAFNPAPAYTEMNLCNIHFHKNAEHKGPSFSKYAGNGDGKGFKTGFVYSGQLSDAELAPTDAQICPSDHGALASGDTIELHYVHSTAQIEPGPTLGACLSEAIINPQLRVETQVYVLVNDGNGEDFMSLTEHGVKNGYHQALNIPTTTGEPVQYDGSTTGPSYNEAGSPLQVSWSVRPEVMKVNIDTVGAWCEDNTFDETYAHGVRNLVTNPALLSAIE